MQRYILKRVGMGLLVLWLVSIFAFALTNLTGDPAVRIAGENASPADIEAVRLAYGFDKPMVQRYIAWVGRAVVGDLGTSYQQKRPVIALLREALPITLTLGVFSLLTALLIATPLAVLGALKPDSAIDRIGLLVTLVGQSMPTMWMSIVMIQVFALGLFWFPISGVEGAKSFVLPSLTLGIAISPVMMRLIRAGMLEVLTSEYIRMARAKGLRSSSIIWKHALRNAVIPAVSVAAVQFGYLLGGSVVVETIFAMQGVGYLAWLSIGLGDLPVVQSIILVTSFFYVLLMIASDLVNAWLDPRLRSR